MNRIHDGEGKHFSAVVDMIREISDRKHRHVNIFPETEIFYDLDIYGDALHDIFVWLEKEHGVLINVNIFDYAPKENFFYSRTLQWVFFRFFSQRPTYKSLKVKDIVRAINEGRLYDR